MVLPAVDVLVPMPEVPTRHLVFDRAFHHRQPAARLVADGVDVEHRLDEPFGAGVREDVIDRLSCVMELLDVLHGFEASPSAE